MRDATRPAPLTGEAWERALVDLLAVSPSPALMDRLDARVQRAVEAADRPAAVRRRRRIGRRGLVSLLAAAALLAGASGAFGLYDGLGAGWDYGFSVQLARSTEVGATAVDKGYRVTIDRAYLDAERLMLALRVTDELERPEVSQLMAMYSVVTDEDGVWAGAGIATSRPLGPWSATNIQWRLAPTPLPAGTHRVHVELPHIFWRDTTETLPEAEEPDWPWHRQRGSWSFDLELPVDGGAVVARPDVSTEIGGVPFRVEQVVVGRTAIRARLTYDDVGGATWSVGGSMRRDGERLPFVIGSLGEPGAIELQTDGGSDDAAGTWTLVIDSATRQVGDGPEDGFDGPWEVEVVVP